LRCLLVAKAGGSLGPLIGVTENISRRDVLIHWQPGSPLEAPKPGKQLAVALEWFHGHSGGARYVRCWGRVVRVAAAPPGEQPLVAMEVQRMSFWRVARTRSDSKVAGEAKYGAQKGRGRAGPPAQASLRAPAGSRVGGRLTKPVLAEELSRVLQIPRMDAALVLEAILESIVGALCRGQRVDLRGVGSFSTRLRRGRMGRNPRTGAPVEVPPRRIPYFRAGKAFKELLNAAVRESVLG